MIKNKHLYNQTLATFESKQAKVNEREFIKEQKLLQNQEYSNVAYELKSTIIDLEKAMYFGKTEQVQKLAEKKESLEKKKSELLKKLTKNNDDLEFECKNCSDEGHLPDGSLCSCFYQTLTNLAYDFIGIRKHKLSDFSQNTLKPNDEEYKIFNKLQIYAKNFNANSKNLIFLGEPGTGKTFIASSILNEVSKRNFNTLYFTSCEFNQVLLNYHLASEYEKSVFYDVLTTSDLIVIDDLGTEPILKNVTLEYLLFIISERISQNKPFIITTNLTLETLESRYGQRLYSRLTGKDTIRVKFTGKDLR